MAVPSAPKGTRDFFPEDMVMRQFIFKSWKRVCRLYGFEQYDGPMFEHLELYTQKSGLEIEKQLYSFKDKGNRSIALRPEMTPTLARMVASKGSALKKPVRWFSIVDLFRYERMQKGRLREFTQLNMDILGIPDESADAELITAVVAMMRDLGLDKDDFCVKISSRQVLEEAFLTLGVDKNIITDIYAVLDKRHKIGEDEFKKQLIDVCSSNELAKKITSLLDISTIEDFDSAVPNLESVGVLKNLFNLFKDYDVSEYVEFDVGIVRGLAYYTGIVFEVFDKQRTLRAIAGGGRYDKLVSLYGGQPTPAIGFAAGDVVLAELLKQKGIKPPPLVRSDVFVVSFNRDNLKSSIKMTQKLRSLGIRTEYSLKLSAIGKQMKVASASGAKWVIFVGGDEEENNNAKIKNMETGIEQVVPIDKVGKIVKD